MKPLLIFGRFAHDPQSVLTAVQQFALVGIELGLYINLCVCLKLRITVFADA